MNRPKEATQQAAPRLGGSLVDAQPERTRFLRAQIAALKVQYVILKVAVPLTLLVAWLGLAPKIWEVFIAVAASPGGGFVLFYTLGSFLLGLKVGFRAIAAFKRDGEASAALGSPGSQEPDVAPEELLRRARHEAAHAVVGWAMGAELISIDLRTVGDRGGRCRSHVDLIDDPTERNWASLVIEVAGNELDLAEGFHDQGSRDDLGRALVSAAAIISTGRSPRDHIGELSTDALLASARREANMQLVIHHRLIDQVAQKLLERPDRIWHEPDLDALARHASPHSAGEDRSR